MANVAKRVIAIVEEQLGVKSPSYESSFVDDLGADSLDTVELVMALEEEFGVEIPDDKAQAIVTVGDAIAYVEKHMGDGEEEDA